MALKVKVAQSCLTFWDPMDPWNSPGQNTGVVSLFLLQGIFPTQGSNPGLPHCRQILYQLSHQGSPRILEWVAYPSPGDLPDPGIKPGSPALQADSLPSEPPEKPILTILSSKYRLLISGIYIGASLEKNPLEKGTATHSSILAWRGRKELNTTERLTHALLSIGYLSSILDTFRS